MTSSTPNKTTENPRRSARVGRRGAFTRAAFTRRAFTMVEMLVVIGILLVMMGILLPGLNRAWKGSVRTRMSADLQAIVIALDAYKADHGGYPPVHEAGTGAHQLARALIGPAGVDTSDPVKAKASDGYGDPSDPKKGYPGFRTRAGGKVYPAYLPVGKFPIVDPLYANAKDNDLDLYTGVIGDRYRQPILYFYGNKLANPSNPEQGYIRPAPYVPMGSSTSFTGVRPMFNSNDSAGYFDPSLKDGPRGGRVRALNLDEGRKRLQKLMGDANQNGYVDATEQIPFTGSYILWSAGPDELFGAPTEGPVGPKNRCDDVANFDRAEY